MSCAEDTYRGQKRTVEIEETKISIRINRCESILAAWNDCSIERASPSLVRLTAGQGGGGRGKGTSERLKRSNFVRAASIRPAMVYV